MSCDDGPRRGATRHLRPAATESADYALVGGLAVSARTEPRFTRDIDVVVATTAGLIALKALAAAPNRLQDEVDLAALIAVATDDDRTAARHLATLVVERGFHRGRDLVAELAEWFR